jgi:hypothetical protein
VFWVITPHTLGETFDNSTYVKSLGGSLFNHEDGSIFSPKRQQAAKLHSIASVKILSFSVMCNLRTADQVRLREYKHSMDLDLAAFGRLR